MLAQDLRSWDLKFGVEHLQTKIDEAIARSVPFLKVDILNKNVLVCGYAPSYDNCQYTFIYLLRAFISHHIIHGTSTVRILCLFVCLLREFHL